MYSQTKEEVSSSSLSLTKVTMTKPENKKTPTQETYEEPEDTEDTNKKHYQKALEDKKHWQIQNILENTNKKHWLTRKYLKTQTKI